MGGGELGVSGGTPQHRQETAAAPTAAAQRRAGSLWTTCLLPSVALDPPALPPPLHVPQVWDLPHTAALSGWLLILITAGAVVCSAIFERRLWCRYL